VGIAEQAVCVPVDLPADGDQLFLEFARIHELRSLSFPNLAIFLHPAYLLPD
jgi:hypothetical protein